MNETLPAWAPARLPGDIAAQLAHYAGADVEVLYADPAWHFKANSKAKPGRNAMRHYNVMSLPEIAALPVKATLARDAVCFMWITGPFLVIGAHIAIMKAWGFRPTAMGFTWGKLKKNAPGLFMDAKADLHFGPGLTTRKNAEFCIIGKRGRSLRLSRSVAELGLFPVMEHSRKPLEFRDRIEEYVGPGRRMVELFARESGPNWVAIGDQLGKFDGRK